MAIETILIKISPIISGWIIDRLFGDPEKLPHPIVLFGNIINWGERRFNSGKKRFEKGALFTSTLIIITFSSFYALSALFSYMSQTLTFIFTTLSIFYCIAGTTLIKEVKMVFLSLEKSLDMGRKRLARIVGRDTGSLNSQQIRIAALETLSENLSDGVIAPLFWYLLLGVPGIFTYKMINTLDSMIGYKNDRYILFGKVAAKIDDIANYIPARLTSMIMLLLSGKILDISKVFIMAQKHSSPNAGYPEAALAHILKCRFGGPSSYFGAIIEKPYIGECDREIGIADMKKAVRLNQLTEIAMITIVCILI